MRRLWIPGVTATAILLLWTHAPAAAQTQKASQPHSPKRLADGHPDLQGVYDIAPMTPLERPRGAQRTYPAEEPPRRGAGWAEHKRADEAPIGGGRPGPKCGGEVTAPAGSTPRPN